MTIHRAAFRLPCLAIILAAGTAHAQEVVRLSLLPGGAASRLGWQVPQKVELSPLRPAALLRLPASLKAPLFAVLPIAGGIPAGTRNYHVALDEPPGGRAALYVDADGDGDLTDDPPAEWTSGGGNAVREGSATVRLVSAEVGIEVRIGFFKRPENQNTLFYYRDYARLGAIELDGVSFPAALSDETASGDFRGRASGASSGVLLLLDLNRDGTFQNPREALDVRRAFNIGGTAYEITDMTPLGDSFRIVKSDSRVAETRPLPNHAVGRKITAFEAQAMDGAAVRFPSDYKGKIVMLDFWATWCVPCMAEMPGLAAVHGEFHPMGFEVLGVSLDNAGQAEKIRSQCEARSMEWRQVYDGGGWQSPIAVLYAIDSIPAAYLVDGDTGEILASGNALRGGSLAPTLERAMRQRGKSWIR